MTQPIKQKKTESGCPFFKPPYPKPNKDKMSFFKRFSSGWNSWIHVLFEKSYKMKLGHVKLPRADIFMPCEPSLVKRVMKTEYKDFPKHPQISEVLKPIFGDGVFVTNGKVWERQRKMMAPAFAQTRLQRVFPLMKEAIDMLIERFNGFNENELTHIDVEMTHVTADIIYRTILSKELKGEEARKLYNGLNDFQIHSQKLAVLSMYCLPTFFQRRKNEEAGNRIKSILSKIIKIRFDEFQKTGKDDKDDILSSLLKAKDDEGNHFSYKDLTDQILTFFLAGHETSASALTWSLYLIASCPDTNKKIRDEVEEVIGGGEIKYEHVKKLTVTHNVFQEALRLYPPVGFFLRQSSKDTKMRDKNIKKGDMVMVSPWMIQRNVDQWDEPNSFCPMRFSDDSAAAKKSVKDSYMPFGLGPRICIGAGFATQESIMILASLVKNFEFKTDPDYTPEPVGRVTIRPKKGIWLYIKKR